MERILWIGFYKNGDNNKCIIDKLPKDLIIYILKFVGKHKVSPPYIEI